MKTFHLLSKTFTLVAFLALYSNSFAQEFVWAPDFPVGAELPAVTAPDQHGNMQTLEELQGDKGMVLLISRSYEWCPYCIRQLGQLIDVAPQLKSMGINVATLTYDPVSILTESALDHEASFPMLSDAPNYDNVKALGILNAQYSPGERPYGIAYPGIFLLDANGVIKAKFAEEDYRERPEFALVLEAAEQL
ncbi:MAG: peroxiredoxin family protein [Pseudohongiellaceae bacterium]|nr:peroxiredoxin family protein [Pseudohongiellaceae bacterium]